MNGHEPSPPWTDELRARLDELLDEHRAMLHDSLDGLTEDEARRSLVPSHTTLLGLVKHVTYVENVWSNQALTGRSLQDLGAPSTPDRSFMLRRQTRSSQCARRTPRPVLIRGAWSPASPSRNR